MAPLASTSGATWTLRAHLKLVPSKIGQGPATPKRAKVAGAAPFHSPYPLVC